MSRVPIRKVVLRACTAVALLAWGATAAAAQRPTGEAPQASAPAQVAASDDTAALVIGTRPVFVFRASLGAVSPAERAAAAARRINDLAEREVDAPVAARAIPEGVLLSVGDAPVLTITPADVDAATGETLALVSTRTAERLTEVLAAEREARSLAHLLQGIALAILATLIFFTTLRALRWVHDWGSRRIPDTVGTRVPALAIRGFTILSASQLLGLAHRIVDIVVWAAGLFAAYLWLAFVLTRFAYSRPWGEALGEYLTVTITGLAVGAISAVPGLFTIVLIFIVTRFLARLVTGFFEAVENGEVSVPWLHPETAHPTRRLVVFLLWIFALVAAFPYIPGNDSDVFKGITVFIGLVISLGSTGLVNQAMSGLTLMYARALKPGDYVRIGDYEGTVTSLSLLSTKLRTTKEEEVTIPNAVVVSSATRNYSRFTGDAGVILHTSVTIGYDTPWRQVHGLLLMAAERTSGLLQDPPPFVLQTALSDFYIEYELNAHLAEPVRRRRVLSELHQHIADCFNEYGVQIMSPHYESDPKQPLTVPRERWFAAPARPAAATARPASGNGGDGRPTASAVPSPSAPPAGPVTPSAGDRG